MEDKQEFNYRCPKCHYTVEREQLFGIGCPVCGWISPLKINPEAKEKSPLMDVFDEKGCMRVVAELPGVKKDDIKVRLESRALRISVNTPDSAYCREVNLPCLVQGIAKTTFNNGILEVIVRKRYYD